jgi:hypothetical protein
MQQNSRDPDDICREMAMVRMHLLRDKQAAIADAKTLIDWRNHFRAHPWLFCAAASAAGYLLVPATTHRPGAAMTATIPLQLAGRKNLNAGPGLDGARDANLGRVSGLLGIALTFAARQSLAYLGRRSLEWVQVRAQRHAATKHSLNKEPIHEEPIW